MACDLCPSTSCYLLYVTEWLTKEILFVFLVLSRHMASLIATPTTWISSPFATLVHTYQVSRPELMCWSMLHPSISSNFSSLWSSCRCIYLIFHGHCCFMILLTYCWIIYIYIYSHMFCYTENARNLLLLLQMIIQLDMTLY